MNNSTKKRELAPEIEILKLIAEMSQEDMRRCWATHRHWRAWT